MSVGALKRAGCSSCNISRSAWTIPLLCNSRRHCGQSHLCFRNSSSLIFAAASLPAVGLAHGGSGFDVFTPDPGSGLLVLQDFTVPLLALFQSKFAFLLFLF